VTEILEPIVHTLELRCAPATAFDAYADIGAWWHPSYTSCAETLATVVIEPRLGGRVFERHRDGHEVGWGWVTAWTPPHRLAYASFLAQPPEHPSEIRVTFTPDVDGCRVRFEHGGWTEENAALRPKFRDWPFLLDRFRAFAEDRHSGRSPA